MKKRILIVEDDAVLTRILRDNLTFEGFHVRSVADGDLAISVAKEFNPDLVLLDINLPGKSGLELCASWRRRPRLPIIILTAKGQKGDKLAGLRLGADDYVTKPFDLEELLARVHAVLRRARPSMETLTLGAVAIDFDRRKASKGSRAIELTHRDFELLQYLAERPNSIVYRDELLREVWGYADTPITRAVDHAIARLRKKIETDPRKPRFIHTVHGDGYYLAPGGEGREPAE